MQTYRLETTQKLQQHLASNFQIYQLIDDIEGNAHWTIADTEQQPRSTQRPPLSSAKGLFFTERENVFFFDGSCFHETLPTPVPFVLFGVHSCDLTAIAYQDQFFANDPYYQARRQQALLIGIDCITPCENGFCHVVDAGPGVSKHCADLILHQHPAGYYLLLVSSDKGAEALKGLELKTASSVLVLDRQRQLDHCKEQFDDQQYISDGIEQLLTQDIADDFWQQVGLQCLACSGCTNLCPTCSCYATRELQAENHDITQQRFWDSCLYEGFQREASQHNPSLQAGARVRRFWTHKFSPAIEQQFGRHGCVGCGRCEVTCPGVIGAHSMMKRIVAYQESCN